MIHFAKVAFVAVALTGLYFHVEYSGWVLFIALLYAVSGESNGH